MYQQPSHYSLFLTWFVPEEDPLIYLYLRFHNIWLIIWGGVFRPHTQPPTWRARVSLLVWVITLDLSSKGDPASSCTTAGIALGIM